jgi:hypothetical protein
MSFKQPGIYYEESPDGLTNGLPFMHIEEGTSIPSVLFMGAVFDTDEEVEGSETGEKVKEVVLQSYYSSEALREKLDEETYQKIKIALGLIK